MPPKASQDQESLAMATANAAAWHPERAGNVADASVEAPTSVNWSVFPPKRITAIDHRLCLTVQLLGPPRSLPLGNPIKDQLAE
jgi:hypothetical protein